MPSPSSLLFTGAVLGLTAGFSPGPLMALVFSETLARGTRAGLFVAVAPVLTDAPIVALAWLVLARMEGSGGLLGAVALAGAAYLALLGWQTLTGRPALEPDGAAGPNGAAGTGRSALKKGVLTNVLSPHPYLFWATVGAPVLVSGARAGAAGPVAFLAGFYVCLLGAKVLLALATGRLRGLLRSTGYVLVLRALGAALLFFSARFFLEGLRLLGLT